MKLYSTMLTMLIITAFSLFGQSSSTDENINFSTKQKRAAFNGLYEMTSTSMQEINQQISLYATMGVKFTLYYKITDTTAEMHYALTKGDITYHITDATEKFSLKYEKNILLLDNLQFYFVKDNLNMVHVSDGKNFQMKFKRIDTDFLENTTEIISSLVSTILY